MRGLWPLSVAMMRGFVRDRMALFFSLLFPLMFLFLFGGIFAETGQSRATLVQIGEVQLLERMPAQARERFDQAFEVEPAQSRGTALQRVREDDADAAIEQRGDQVVLHYSQADPVEAATVQGTMASFVQSANLALTGQPPRLRLDSRQVEDESLEAIQYFTPGLLGWAVAMSATFGAALTLVQWRTTKLLRRLRLAPVSTGSLVAARIVVSIAVAFVQVVVFVVLAVLVFGLRLSGWWWMSLPLVVAGTLSFMAIGLLAGAVSKTSEGASGLANLVVLPMAFLSGSFIPLDVAPAWLQAVSRAMPLRYLNDGMLDVMVRGQGPAAVLAPIGVLLAFALVLGLLATRFFRWEAH